MSWLIAALCLLCLLTLTGGSTDATAEFQFVEAAESKDGIASGHSRWAVYFRVPFESGELLVNGTALSQRASPAAGGVGRLEYDSQFFGAMQGTSRLHCPSQAGHVHGLIPFPSASAVGDDDFKQLASGPVVIRPDPDAYHAILFLDTPAALNRTLLGDCQLEILSNGRTRIGLRRRIGAQSFRTSLRPAAIPDVSLSIVRRSRHVCPMADCLSIKLSGFSEQSILDGVYHLQKSDKGRHWVKRLASGNHLSLYRASNEVLQRKWVIGNMSRSFDYKYAHAMDSNVCLRQSSPWNVWKENHDDFEEHQIHAECVRADVEEVDDSWEPPIMAAIELRGSAAINAKMDEYMQTQQFPAVLGGDVPRCAANVIPFLAQDQSEKCALLAPSGISRIVAPSLANLLIGDVPHNISVLVGDAVPKSLTDDIVDHLKDTIAPSVAGQITARATGAIFKHLSTSLGADAIPEKVNAILPRYVNRGITKTLTQTLTKAVTRASCPALATAMKLSPEMDSICYACFYNRDGPYYSQHHCDRCVIDPKTMYYTNYWCEYYSEWYSNYYSKYYSHKHIDEWQMYSLKMNSDDDDQELNLS